MKKIIFNKDVIQYDILIIILIVHIILIIYFKSITTDFFWLLLSKVALLDIVLLTRFVDYRSISQNKESVKERAI